jgi:pimeloyl-ACP methyl ester carboxylesterase
MPYVDNNGVKIWWQEQGRGEPVLAIMGLSFSLEMWHRTAPVLAKKFRVILFDNRGVGRSDVPRGPYLIARMAGDAAAVMSAAGLRSAHVMGASMGGMIAQEFALQYPHRVRSLMLGCTWCGGRRAVRPDFRSFPSLGEFQRLSAEAKMRSMIPLLYAAGTPKERIEEDIALRLQFVPTTRGYYSQLLGTVVWQSWNRLPRIHHPVKIMHGAFDRLIPVANARLLESRLPDARTFIVPDAGHVFTTDQPEIVNRETMAFLEEMADRRDPMGLLA